MKRDGVFDVIGSIATGAVLLVLAVIAVYWLSAVAVVLWLEWTRLSWWEVRLLAAFVFPSLLIGLHAVLSDPPKFRR